FVLFLESCAPLVNSLNLGLASPFVLGPPPFQLAQIKTHLALQHLAASGGRAPPHAGVRQALLKDAMFSPRGTMPPRPRGPNPSGTKPPAAFGAAGAPGPPRKSAPATPQGTPQRFSGQDTLQWTGSQRINVRVTLHRADPRKVKEKSNLHQEQKDPRATRWDSGPGTAGPKPPGPAPPPPVLEQNSNPQNRYTPESASSILASFGLSNEDLEELSRYPDDQLTPENMPRILREIRIRKLGHAPPMPPVLPPILPALLPTPLPQPLLPPVMPPLVQPPASQHVLPPLTTTPLTTPPLATPPFSAGLLAAISHHEQKQRETSNAHPSTHPGTHHGTHPGTHPSTHSGTHPGAHSGPGTATTGGSSSGHKPYHKPYRSSAEEPIKSPFGVVKASWLPVFSDSQKSKRLPTPSMMNDYYATSPRIFPHLCSLCNLECTHMK
ncbi:ZN638 protein, partial [Hippolais icterina]|nr:ZN638 protein [Hippolais icterina]